VSIDKTEKIDVVKRNSDGSLRLVLTDDREWGDDEHLWLLQEKLNSYIAFIETGQVREMDGVGPDTSVWIEIVTRHEPDDGGRKFLRLAGEKLAGAGIPMIQRIEP